MKSKYFTVEELVAPEILAIVEPNAAWRMVAPFVWTLDAIREATGPIVVNARNGYKYSGLRPKDCTTGAKRSSHKGVSLYEQGFDLHAPKDQLLVILTMIRTMHKGLRVARIEDPSVTLPGGWLHIEVRDGIVDGLLIEFKP